MTALALSSTDPAAVYLARLYAILRRRGATPNTFFAAIVAALDDGADEAFPPWLPSTHVTHSSPLSIHEIASNAGQDVLHTVGVDDAAAALRLSNAAVEERVRERSLVGYMLGGEVRLPGWQFSSSGDALPNLRALAGTIAELDVQPIRVARFMTTPQHQLVGLGALTPAVWLTKFRPQRVVQQLRRLEATVG